MTVAVKALTEEQIPYIHIDYGMQVHMRSTLAIHHTMHSFYFKRYNNIQQTAYHIEGPQGEVP